jgi:ubiquinone/menaquinone biosynthesis C-methylase UbiE
MPDHRRIYQEEALKYRYLIDREDYRGELLPAMRTIIPLDGLDVIDLGAGTGRLALLLAPYVETVSAFDLSSHMLGVAATLLDDLGTENWTVSAADHRRIPLRRNSADLVISGWSFCYLAVWAEHNWRSALEEGLLEINRLLRQNGKIIIIETLGTGVTEPQAPDKLQPYFYFLGERGFQSTWIRTDYRFRDPQEACELTEFFFGEEMLAHLEGEDQPILPECTGIWWK